MFRVSLLGLPPDAPGTRLFVGVYLVHRSQRSLIEHHLYCVCRPADQERQFTLFRLAEATEYVAGYLFLASDRLAQPATHSQEGIARHLDDRSQSVVTTVSAADLDANLAEGQVDLVVDDDRLIRLD